MSVYASNPQKRPDEEFEPGELRHLVPGNRGRMLDPRRTPVSVVEVQPDVGFADLRIEGFEDVGAVWQVPLEDVGHYQFEPHGPRATDAAVAEMEAAIERFDHSLSVETDGDDRTRTEARITERQADADAWLSARSRFLTERRALPHPSTRRGDALLAADLEAYLRGHELWHMEHAFARQFVSNPRAGEVVKGHRIVLAQLGLARYEGPIVRDRVTLDGDWSKERRAQHIVARLAFVRALFARLAIDSVTLWRGLSTESELRHPDSGRTFVSTSFDEAVARVHYDGGSSRATRVLVQQVAPVEHLFMTYLETAAMNTVFREAEAVLLARPDDRWP